MKTPPDQPVITDAIFLGAGGLTQDVLRFEFVEKMIRQRGFAGVVHALYDYQRFPPGGCNIFTLDYMMTGETSCMSFCEGNG